MTSLPGGPQQPAFTGGRGPRRPALAQILQQGRSSAPGVQAPAVLQLTNQSAASAQANAFAQLGQAIDAGGNAAATFLFAEKEKQAIADRADRRQATIEAQTDFAEYMEKLANDPSLGPGPEVEDLSEWVDEQIADRISDFPPAYQEAYREHWLTRGTAALADFRIDQREQAQVETIGIYREQAFTDVRTAGDLTEMIGELKDADIDEKTAWANVGVPLLEQLALAGDRERFAAVREALGDRHTTEQLRAEAMLERTIAGQDSARAQQFQEAVSSLYTSGRTFDDIEEFITTAENVTEKQRLAALDNLDVRVRRAQSQATAEARAAMRERTLNGILEGVHDRVVAGDGILLQPIEAAMSDGTIETFQPKEIIEATYSRYQQELAGQVERGEISQEQATTAAIQFLVSNDHVDPADERLLAGGLGGLSQAAITGKVTEAGRLAYERYRQLYAVNGAYVGDVIGEQSAETYRMLDILAQYVHDGDVNLAAADLKNILERGGSIPTIDGREFDKATDWLNDGSFVSGIKNFGDMRDVYRSRVKVLMSLGLDQKTAQKEARDDFKARYKRVRNTWIPADRELPPNFSELSRAFAEESAAANEGVSASDISLVPAPGDRNTYYLRDTRTMQSVPGPDGTPVAITNRQLTEYGRRLAEEERSEEISRIEYDDMRSEVSKYLVRTGGGERTLFGLLDPSSIDRQTSWLITAIDNEAENPERAADAKALLAEMAVVNEQPAPLGGDPTTVAALEAGRGIAGITGIAARGVARGSASEIVEAAVPVVIAGDRAAAAARTATAEAATAATNTALNLLRLTSSIRRTRRAILDLF